MKRYVGQSPEEKAEKNITIKDIASMWRDRGLVGRSVDGRSPFLEEDLERWSILTLNPKPYFYISIYIDIFMYIWVYMNIYIYLYW